MHENLKDRFADISQKIQAACHNAKRSEKDVQLIAVSKLQSIQVIKKALCERELDVLKITDYNIGINTPFDLINNI